MGIFLPSDLPGRILEFMNCKVDLPIVIQTELMACFFLFGKNHGVHGELEILNVKNLARKTVTQISNEVKRYANLESAMNQELVRQNFLKRSMQITVDAKEMISSGDIDLNRRISRDPTILTDIFTFHIAYYKEDYFFHLFDPLPGSQLPADIRDLLDGRMLMLGFNTKDSSLLRYPSLLTPFIEWIRSC
jgi:hypothetical protein